MKKRGIVLRLVLSVVLLGALLWAAVPVKAYLNPTTPIQFLHCPSHQLTTDVYSFPYLEEKPGSDDQAVYFGPYKGYVWIIFNTDDLSWGDQIATIIYEPVQSIKLMSLRFGTPYIRWNGWYYWRGEIDMRLVYDGWLFLIEGSLGPNIGPNQVANVRQYLYVNGCWQVFSPVVIDGGGGYDSLGAD